MAGRNGNRPPGVPRKPSKPDPNASHGGLGDTAVSVLYTGRARLALIRDLALAEWSPRELADQLGLPQEDIAYFANEHADDIAEVRQALAGQLAIETAGLWIAKKQLRIAELQAEVERIDETLKELREDREISWSRSHRDMLHTKLAIFRQTADELGAYPQRQQPPARQGTTVHYVIESEDEDTDTEALT
jgi:hypothetical protein